MNLVLSAVAAVSAFSLAACGQQDVYNPEFDTAQRMYNVSGLGGPGVQFRITGTDQRIADGLTRLDPPQGQRYYEHDPLKADERANELLDSRDVTGVRIEMVNSRGEVLMYGDYIDPRGKSTADQDRLPIVTLG